jgi:hypothetical protein
VNYSGYLKHNSKLKEGRNYSGLGDRYLFPIFFLLFFLTGQGIELYAQTKTSTGTSWTTASHWSPFGVPASNNSVIINTNMSVGTNAVCNSLTINSSRILTINSTNSITAGAGGITNNGTITLIAGTSTTSTRLISAGNYNNNGGSTLNANGTYSVLSFNGSTAQSFTNNGTVTAPLYTLSVSNSAGLTLSGTSQINVYRVNLLHGIINNSNLITLGMGGSSTCIVQCGPNNLSSPRGHFDQYPTFNLGTAGIQLLYTNASEDYNTSYEIPADGLGISLFYLEAIDRTVYLDKNISIQDDFSNSLNLVSGNLNIGGNTITLSGTIGLGSGTLTGGASSGFILNGNVSTTLPAISGGLNQLSIDNPAGIILGGNVTTHGNLSLIQGIFSNGSYLSIANSSTITRSGGSLVAAPTFEGTVNLVYSGNTAISAGVEMPVDTTVLKDLTVNSGGLIQSDLAGITTNLLTENFNTLGAWTGNIGTTYNQFNAVNSAYAGGSANEARYVWGNSSNTYYEASIYRSINTTGYQAVNIEWKQFIDNYNGTSFPYTIRVQCASSTGGPWTDIYTLSPTGTGNIGPQVLSYPNWTVNVGNDFVIRYQIEGYTYGVDYWYFDDLIIEGVEFTPSEVTVNGLFDISAGTYDINGNKLILKGSLTGSYNLSGGTGSDLTVSGSGSNLLIPGVTGGITDFTINRQGGVTMGSDLTVDGVLYLQSENPSASQGLLEMGTDTLFFTTSGTTIGQGDVTGIVKRTTIAPNVLYTFGNQNTTVKIPDIGTMPSSWAVKTTLGQAPAWKEEAIFREYDIVRSGGQDCYPSVQLAYRDEELNGNAEENLVFWGNVGGLGANEFGRINASSTENWVGLSGTITFAPTDFGINLWTLSASESPKFTWSGVAPGDETNWNNNLNWTGGVVPTDTSEVIIPAGCGYYPVLPDTTAIRSIYIAIGAEVTAGAGSAMTITGGANAWDNHGTFYPANSTVYFTDAFATISGETDFYNVTLVSGAGVTLTTYVYLRIAGALINNGTLHADLFSNTIEFNGGDQNIINPNGAMPGYNNLILSGSGNKTMPVTSPEVLDINGIFHIIGTASAIAQGVIVLHDDFLIGENASFNAGSFAHVFEGDWTNEGGTFIAGSSTLSFEGSVLQTITCNGGFEAHHLIIDNTSASVILGASTNCSLTGDLSVGSGSQFDLSQNQLLSIAGNINNTGTIITSNTSATPVPSGLTWGGTFEYAATASQTAVSGTYNNLNFIGAGGAIASGNISVNGILDLAVSNPSTDRGLLEMTTAYEPAYASYTLLMGENATTTGPGDVTGIVSRTVFLPDVSYSFGSEFSTVTFPDIGTLPTSMSLKIIIGEAPSWKPDAIFRHYDLIQTGAISTLAIVNAHYKDTELNGNDENGLVNWVCFFTPDPLLIEYGRSDFNTFENWVSISDVDIGFFSQNFGASEITLGESQLLALTWNGSVSSSWNTIENWTPNGSPSDFTAITIPDAAGTTYDPLISTISACGSILIEEGGILNGQKDATLTLNSPDLVWDNRGGTFNADSSTVICTNPFASMRGSSTFHNLTINSDAVLFLADSAYLGITGALLNNGVLRTVYNGESTVEYKGSDQTVIIPNEATNRYSNLILSGSGTKTLPDTSFTITGDLTVSGTALVAAADDISIAGNFTIESEGVFNASSHQLSIGGDFLIDGAAFECSTGTIDFNGTGTQTITDQSGFTAYHLNISNSGSTVLLGELTSCTVGGGLSIGAGSTFDLVTNPIISLDGTITNYGKIITRNTSATPVPSGLQWGGTFEYAGTAGTQSLVPGSYHDLILSGESGAVATGNITVKGELNLASANPELTRGILDMDSHILHMDSTAITIGFGDVSGTVSRSYFETGIPYTFGSAHTSVSFSAASSLPTEMQFRIKPGLGPVWNSGAILRYYDIKRTGGSNFEAQLSFRYLEPELNNNSEYDLSVMDYELLTGESSIRGRSALNSDDGYVMLDSIGAGDIPEAFDERQWTLANQSLTGVSVEKTGSTSSSSFVTLTDAEVTIDVTGVNKVYVIATFSSWMSEGTALTTYRTADLADPDNICSDEINRSNNATRGIGSVIHIFDVGAFSGERTYAFQFKTDAGTLNSVVTLTAIALFDGTDHLNCDHVNLTGQAELTAEWQPLLTSDTVSSSGGYYVASVTNSRKSSGGETVVGEWKIQFREVSDTLWNDLSYTIPRSTSGTGVGVINYVGALYNSITGNYQFRVVHRKTVGDDPVVSENTQLVVIGLGTDNGYFPVFISSQPLAVTSDTAFTSVLENYIKSQTNTDLFLHSQYGCSSDGTSDGPRYDLYMLDDATVKYNGIDYHRSLANANDLGSGVISGFISSLEEDLSYRVSVRHASTTGRTLTTNSAYLCGFGLTRSSLPFINPVTVNATEGLTSSSYPTLKDAFDNINLGIFRGDIVITINDNTAETETCELYASGDGDADYTSIHIYPTAPDLKVEGGISSSLINFNGVDNLTIDGRVNLIGGADLTFSNLSVTGSVFQYFNDASDNVIRYCRVVGVNNLINSGTIVFSTGAIAGNDNNTIEFCDIKAGSTTPTNAIYSAGSSVTADNSGITVANCNISDFFNAGLSSNGIYLASNSSAWTITGNKFFQSAARVSLSDVTHRAIQINTSFGVDYTINNNIIGFADVEGTGITSYSGDVDVRYRAIELRAGVTTPSLINGNIISGISFSTASNYTATPGIFSGIAILAGNVNVGSDNGNIIGAAEVTGSISISSANSLGLITGIYYTTTGNAEIKNNTIGAILTSGTALTGYTFSGIQIGGVGGNFIISSNLIGSLSTPHSISIGTMDVTTTPVCTFRGILNPSSGSSGGATGSISINSNTVQHCSVYGTGASVLYGIINQAGTSSVDINENNIIALTLTGTGTFNPLINSASVTSLNINGNILRDFRKKAATGIFYVVSNSGTIINSISINNNQLGNEDGGLITYETSNATALIGIRNTGGSANCELEIKYNDIRGIIYETTQGTNAHTYIINSAATLKQDISYNTFTDLNVDTRGAIIFISNSVALPANGVQLINNNSIVNSFTRAASSGALTLFTSTASTNNTNVTVNNNDNNFSNITINGSASILGWVNTDAGTGAVNKTIARNVFSNWAGGTGSITAMNISITSENNRTKENTISGISSSGTIYGISTAAGSDSIYANEISSLNTTGGSTGTIISGINVTSGTAKYISGNSITGITGNSLTTGSARGIFVSSGSYVTVRQNIISNITANANTSGTISGIWVSGGSTVNLDRNKIYDISSTSPVMSGNGAVYGIQVSGTTAGLTVNISNNIIGDFRAPNISSTTALRGIGVINTGTSSSVNAYYNSVYLAATSSGTNFGSTGVYHTASTTATTSSLDLRNNIIVNLSTPNGSGQAVAFGRSSGLAGRLNNYALTSNNNLFYAGVPGPSRLIYSDGTSTAQTLEDYKSGEFTAGTIAPRDQVSVTENAPFISTSGADTTFLKIDDTIETQIESGALSLTSYPIDFEGTIRQGNPGYTGESTTAPDIGAFEGDYEPVDAVPPSITYTPPGDNSCLNNKTIHAFITDGTGVDTVSGTRPRIWYKKSGNSNVLPSTNDNTSDGWKYTEAGNTESPFIFTLDYSRVFGGVTAGDTIQYFIVAQDIMLPPHVGINAGTFASMPASVDLTSSAFPIGGTINSFKILDGLSNIVTIGASGDYPSLSGTGGLFAAINENGLSSDLVAEIIDPLITETGTVSLNPILYGCEDNYTLTVRPAESVNALLTGNVAGAMIHLSGADHITFDGINASGRSLTISNTSTSTSASTIRLSEDACNNTFTNCILEGSSTGINSGIVVFLTGSASGNDSNTISQNNLRPAGTNMPAVAIYSAGAATNIDNSDNTISNNNIQDYFSADGESKGIYIASNSSAWTVSGNKFFQTGLRTATSGAVHRAIHISTLSGNGYLISDNIIGYASAASSGVSAYNGAAAIQYRAVEVSAGSLAASNIQGNIIAAISFSTTSASTANPGIFSGIAVLAGNVNIGTEDGNIIGDTTVASSIVVTSTGSLGVITGIYVNSGNSISIANNHIAGISTGGTALIGYTFHGILTAGTGVYTITANKVGSATVANSVSVGTSGITTTPVCVLNGIYNLATGSISLKNNSIRNVSVYGTGNSSLNGIINSGLAGTVSIDTNQIISANNTGNGTMTGISNTAAVTSLQINGNTIRNLVKNVAGGAVTGIVNSGAVLSQITIDHNSLGNADSGLITYSVANSAALTGIYNTTGSASCSLSVQNNDIRGINATEACSHTHTYIYNTAPTLSQDINYNTFTDLNINTTGSVYFIRNSVTLPTNAVQNVNGNSISGSYTIIPSGGTVTLFTSTTATNNSDIIVNNNFNDFSNINVGGSTAIAGWVNTDAGSAAVSKTLEGNTFSNWTAGTGSIVVMNVGINSVNNATKNNVIHSISSAGSITGITTGAGNDSIMDNTIHSLVSSAGSSRIVNGIAVTTGGTAKYIHGNTIYDLQANNISTGNVSAISIAGGLTVDVCYNKIFTISSSSSSISTGSVNGILVSGSEADQVTTILNNRIGEIEAPAANVSNPVRGISVINNGLRSTTNVYYNTIYLSAASSGGTFGSSGIYHAASTNESTGALVLRNNIIANLSSSNGSGLTVVLRRSAGTANMLNNYAIASNNNLFYSGELTSQNLIFHDGVSLAQSLEDYKAGVFTAGTISPRDQASITENPHVTSIDGQDIDFLKIDSTVVTFIESGGENIAGFPIDFEGDIRAGNSGYPEQNNGFGTAPDIGADEFDGSLPRLIVSGSHPASNGNYANLRSAFAAVNSQDQSGNNILITLMGSTSEDTTAQLNAGAWTSLKIYPETSNATISGTIDNAPLIELNGADNVTIDGRINQTGSTKNLTMVNNSNGSENTSTLRFLNSSENNILKYCIIQGASSGSGVGMICFATSVSGNGNDNNVIEYSNISGTAGDRPVHAIFSQGSPGYDNSENIIRNNNIFNFLNPSVSSSGINLKAHTSGWTIQANSFYESSTFVPGTGPIQHGAIWIDNTSGNEFSITGNYIGGSAPSCGGGAWTSNAQTGHSFIGIKIQAGTVTASSIQNNMIWNWNYTSAASRPWCAIETGAGAVNIGTLTGNVIGAAGVPGSVTVSSSVNAHSFGIYIESEGTVNISKNTIRSVTVSGSDTDYSHGFTAIHKASGIGGTISIFNNTIGSNATQNSINASSQAVTSSSGQDLVGIYAGSSGSTTITSNIIANLTNAYAGSENSRTRGIQADAGTLLITRNTIHHLSSAALCAGFGSVTGIELNGTDQANIVSENTVRELSSSGATFSGFIAGIQFSGNTGSNILSANFIRELAVHASSSAAVIYGLKIDAGAVTCSNNIISLIGNTATTVYGLFETGSTSNDNDLYFNSIYIGGNLVAGTTNPSYAFFSNSATNQRDFRNNIFANFRSTASGVGLHYAAYYNYGTESGLVNDYNSYYAGGTGGMTGYYNGADVNTLPVIPLQDANSYSGDPQYANAGGNLAEDYKLTSDMSGVFGTGVMLDYGMTARGDPPSIGAWEFNTNRWFGTVDSNFANAANWSAGAVPLEDAPVVFAANPLRDCYLDTNRSVGSIINGQSDYKLVINGRRLTVKGGLYLSDGGRIDAQEPASTVIFSGETEVQIIPDSAFTNNIVPRLILNNPFGVVSESDLTVIDTLSLQLANPTDTTGCLHTGENTITLGENAVTTGPGDATGIVKRSVISPEVDYTFGNQNARISFLNTGTLPTEISVKISIGRVPSWKTEAVKRVYEIIQSGANPYNPTSATIHSTYLDSELNGNTEHSLVNWSYNFASELLIEHGRASFDTISNTIKLTNINMAFFPSSFGNLEIGLDEGELDTLTWNGSLSSSWTTPYNWTPIGAPSDQVNIIIPDAATTNNDPVIPPETTIETLRIENGGIVNTMPGAVLHILGGTGAWVNEGGTFNAGTSTVTFNNADALFTGETIFNNVTINPSCRLFMDNLSHMKIGGVLTNHGLILPVPETINTIEYNGSDQTVVVPNPATNRYSTLILSGSGTKTMPSTALSIWGSLILSGQASVTALNNLIILEGLTIGPDASFTAGNHSHTIGGNFTDNGIFNGEGSTFSFNGFTPQNISGASSSTTFNNLSIVNDAGVTCLRNLSVTGALTLQSENPDQTHGCLDMTAFTLSLGSQTVTSGPGDVSGIVRRAHTFENGTAYTFGNRYMTLVFGETGTKPSEIKIKASLGSAVSWMPSSVKRIYDIAQTGGGNCGVNASVAYLTSELNGNSEDELVCWGATGFLLDTINEWGRSEIDTLNNRLILNNIPIELWPAGLGEIEITLAESGHPTMTWNGSQNDNWNLGGNWSPYGFPSRLTRLIIPDSSTTLNDPLQPAICEVFSIRIEENGFINTVANAELSVFGHQDTVWSNFGGIFNANNGTVTFFGEENLIAGATGFYNLHIVENAGLTLLEGSVTGIAGALTNEGLLEATLYNNTIDYNGDIQTVILPNGITEGYSSLTLSGSGLKTMPSHALHFYGNLTLAGSAQATALNDMIIDGSLTVEAGAEFNAAGYYMTIGGNIIHDGNLALALSTVELTGNEVQHISGSATSTVIRHLLVHQLYGAVSSKDITVNGELCLHNDNPGLTTGVLTMENSTLDLGPAAYVSGFGDATGIVRRTTIARHVTYAFGNRNATVTFNDAGTLPTQISVRISIGNEPAWKPGAIKRFYEIIQTGADPYNPTQARIHTAYRDPELNGNQEFKLVNWSYRNPPGLLNEHGRSAIDTTENWVELTNINMAFFPSTFGTLSLSLDESEIENLTWNGSVSSSWTTVDNWTPNGAPSSFVNVTIPDAATTPNIPYLNFVSEVLTLTIEDGGILNTLNGASFNIYGGSGAWANEGTYNPDNTTVVFNHAEATISGETDFRNLSIASGASLTPQNGSILRVAGTMSNNGTLHAAVHQNIIEYNGADQAVIPPNGTVPGYHSLVLSGSGTKTFPSSSLEIHGDLTLNGNYFMPSGNTIIMNGSAEQHISGTVAPIFNNLTINSTAGVTATVSTSVIGNLTLTGNNPSVSKGSLHMQDCALTMGASATTTGTADVTGIVQRTAFTPGTSYTFGSQFTTMNFAAGGTLPDTIFFKITKSPAPGWKTDAIARHYEIVRSGGANTTFDLGLHYQEDELVNNNESNLAMWIYQVSPPLLSNFGKDSANVTNNLVYKSNAGFDLLATEYDQLLWTLGEYNTVVIDGVKGWRMISSPTATTYADLLGGFITQGLPGSTYPLKQPNFIWFDETDTLTTNMSWRNINALTDSIIPGRGYYFYVFGEIEGDEDYNLPLPRTMSVDGASNFRSGEFSFSNGNHPVTFTPRSGTQETGTEFFDTNVDDEGWNMIGNPSTFTLDWNAAAGWLKSNLDNAIYTWDPNAGDWKIWNGVTGTHDGLIPPFQAFWVRANDQNPGLSFTEEVFSQDTGTFYKNDPDIKAISVPIRLSHGTMETHAFITFMDDGVEGGDPWDAYRLEPLGEQWLELFSLSSPEHSSPLVINNLPVALEDMYNLPLFVGGQIDGNEPDGECTLGWDIPPEWPSEWRISLHDHLTRNVISMKSNNSYHFTTESQGPVTKSISENFMTLPGSIVTPVSSSSLLKSSQELPRFSIIIQKFSSEENEYIGLKPRLITNFPNPFQKTTHIRFSLPVADHVSLRIYDMYGQLVDIVAEEYFEAGVHTLTWHSYGTKPGVYLANLKTKEVNDAIKLIIAVR